MDHGGVEGGGGGEVDGEVGVAGAVGDQLGLAVELDLGEAAGVDPLDEGGGGAVDEQELDGDVGVDRGWVVEVEGLEVLGPRVGDEEEGVTEEEAGGGDGGGAGGVGVAELLLLGDEVDGAAGGVGEAGGLAGDEAEVGARDDDARGGRG